MMLRIPLRLTGAGYYVPGSSNEVWRCLWSRVEKLMMTVFLHCPLRHGLDFREFPQ